MLPRKAREVSDLCSMICLTMNTVQIDLMLMHTSTVS